MFKRVHLIPFVRINLICSAYGKMSVRCSGTARTDHNVNAQASVRCFIWFTAKILFDNKACELVDELDQTAYM